VTHETVYIETTFVSYLTARPSRDIVLAAKQQTTREWWEFRRPSFTLRISQVVLDELSQGDEDAARRRLEAVVGLPLLDVTPEATLLAEAICEAQVLPKTAARDALHMAIAAAHGMDFLLTWNCAHLANAEIRRLADRFIEAQGLQSPAICTPDELMGEQEWPEIPS
jgi:hypothetical protein